MVGLDGLAHMNDGDTPTDSADGALAGLWLLVFGTTSIGAFAAEVAATEAIAGAATPSQTRTLTTAAGIALLSLAIGIGVYTSLCRTTQSAPSSRTRRRLALLTVLVGGTMGVARVTSAGGRLVRHVELDRDEPLTTVSLALQTAVAFAAYAVLVAFALVESRLVGRRCRDDHTTRSEELEIGAGPSGL